MNPQVSVLIPTYNYGEFIGDTLDSVFAQTFTNYEVIVVDDGSSDNTAQIVGKYPRVKYIYQPHQGISVARNRLLKEAAGEVIAFLDADDIWHPEKLEKQLAYMREHPACDIIFCEVNNFFSCGVNVTKRSQELFLASVDFYLAGACIKTCLFEKIGMFLEKYAYGEDTEWVLRAAASGINITHKLPLVLYMRRIHNRNISLSHSEDGRTQRLKIFCDAIRRAKK